MSGELTMSKNMDVAINARIAEIDRLLSAQLNEIMHHEEFQKLEGSWRGLTTLSKTR
jgi:type VI secretion system protein ImpC